MRIIIDAYNVIRTNPEGKHIESNQGNQAARDWLVNLCRRALQAGEEWFLVFDGDGIASEEKAKAGNMLIRYAHPLTADEIIRELGENAVAMQVPARIVSSDGEVRVTGCELQDSETFFSFVTARKPDQSRKNKTPPKTELAEKIVNTLFKKGYIKQNISISYQVKDGLVQLIAYLYNRKQKPQKMARAIEKYVRIHLRVEPDPDPQKQVLRTIKQLLA